MSFFAFRVDASLQIGTGHVMRCLTLADALRERGTQSTFICRPHAGHLLDLIQQRGHTAKALAPADDAFTAPADPCHSKWLGTDWVSDVAQTKRALGCQVVDWLVVDHYALDRRWEQAMRPHTRRIMAIDDLVDRPHDCDLLLDQNLGRQAKDYGGLLSRHTQTIIGPAYALLRPEFAQWREHSLQRRVQPKLKNLLITMGGVDQANATGQVLDALTRCELPTDLRITVVMGPTAPWLAHVQAQAATMPRPTQVLMGVNNMAQLMAESDVCIGAAGGIAWERCAMGLPTLVLILAANQQSGAMALQAYGAAWVAADAQQLMAQLTTLFNKETQTAALQKMSQAAANLATGSGASQVIEKLLKPHCTVRALTEDDLPMVLVWRNHPEIRRFMFTQHEITLIEHLTWFKKTIQDSSRRLLIVQEDCYPIGYVQFSNVQKGGVADWGFYLRPNVVKGTGWKLGSAALKHAFLDLELNKVCGQAIASNYKSIRFHERLGFNREIERNCNKDFRNELQNIVCFEIHFDKWKSLNL